MANAPRFGVVKPAPRGYQPPPKPQWVPKGPTLMSTLLKAIQAAPAGWGEAH